MAEDDKRCSTVMGYPAPAPSFYQYPGYAASTQSRNQSSAAYGYAQPPTPYQSTGLNYGSNPTLTTTGGGARYPSIQPNTTTNIGNNHSFVQIPPTRADSPPPPQSSNEQREASTEIWISILAVLAFVFFVITYALYKTTAPKIEVHSLSVISFNVSHSQISANWDMDISILKPTGRKIKNHDRVDVSVYYKNEFLSGTVVGPIQLHSNGQGLFQANVTASSKDIPNSIADSMTADYKEHGTVSFNVNLRFSHKSIFGRVHDLGASCEGLGIEFSSDSGMGNMPPGRSRTCKITSK